MSSDLALSIRALKFRYPGSSRWTVDIPELDLPSGGAMLLTGGSGSGKSTLLQLVAGLMEPTEGRVRVAGRDLAELRGTRRDQFRGRHIGFIFQTFNLLSGFTALENVMAALMFSSIPAGEHRRRARELLEGLGIERPGAMVDRLSVGQQQRVAVARAVACDPALVLADEPTASLDPENAAAAMTLIQETCRRRGAALLCVSHDPSMHSRFARRGDLVGGYLKPERAEPPPAGVPAAAGAA